MENKSYWAWRYYLYEEKGYSPKLYVVLGLIWSDDMGLFAGYVAQGSQEMGWRTFEAFDDIFIKHYRERDIENDKLLMEEEARAMASSWGLDLDPTKARLVKRCTRRNGRSPVIVEEDREALLALREECREKNRRYDNDEPFVFRYYLDNRQSNPVPLLYVTLEAVNSLVSWTVYCAYQGRRGYGWIEHDKNLDGGDKSIDTFFTDLRRSKEIGDDKLLTEAEAREIAKPMGLDIETPKTAIAASLNYVAYKCPEDKDTHYRIVAEDQEALLARRNAARKEAGKIAVVEAVRAWFARHGHTPVTEMPVDGEKPCVFRYYQNDREKDNDSLEYRPILHVTLLRLRYGYLRRVHRPMLYMTLEVEDSPGNWTVRFARQGRTYEWLREDRNSGVAVEAFFANLRQSGEIGDEKLLTEARARKIAKSLGLDLETPRTEMVALFAYQNGHPPRIAEKDPKVTKRWWRWW